ncbi:MAG: hypothetical protein IJV99_01925 [Clostridia bacterium]|nr:hypothetical protein [Clostridia bacterium]
MKTFKKKIFSVCLAVLALLCFGVALVASQRVSADPAPRAVTELFMPSNLSLQTAYVDEEGETSDAGLLISSSIRGESIQFRNQISGEFQLTTSPIIKEGNPTVQTLVYNVADVNSEKAFDIVIRYGSQVNVSVRYQGEEVGLCYLSNSLRGVTTLANAKAVYTQYSSTVVPVVFKPEEMGVYLGTGEEEILVWSFLTNQADGRTVGFTLPVFTRYQVSVCISEFVGETAGIVLYSVNGSATDKIILNGQTNPVVFADFKLNGVVDTEYSLPKPYAYDLWDGPLSSVDTSVIDPQGNQVTIKKGAFTPDQSGTYTITYSATNSFGTVGSKCYEIEIYDEYPEYEFEILGELPEIIKTGKTVHVPKMTLSKGLLYYGSTVANVKVYRNNILQSRYNGVQSGFDYTISYNGVYRFDYLIGNDVYSLQTTATSKLDEIEFSYEFKDTYKLNDFINLSNQTLFINGQETEYSLTITYPDGITYDNKQFTLTKTGSYVAKVTALTGERLAKEFEFKVYDKVSDLFSTMSDGVTLEYGTNLFTGVDGVKVTMKSNATEIKYEQPIDVTKYVDQTKPNNTGDVVHGEDKIYIKETATPIVSFSMEPKSYNSQPMRFVTVILTDAEDPTNTVSVLVDSANEGGWSYLRAKAGNQTYVGWNSNTSKGHYAEGKLMTENGTVTHHSFKGTPNSSYMAKDSKIDLYYDNEQKQVLCYAGYDVKHSGNICCIIADFDNPNLSKGDAWKGFTSDKVYLSILFGTITSQASCVIYSVDGNRFDSENRTFVNPQIAIDGEKSLVGLKGQKITIPNAVAYDSDGKEIEKVYSQAFYNKGGNLYDLNVTNGEFETPYDGEYLIKYYAKDKFGNVGENQVEVYVYESYQDMTVDASVPNEYLSGKTGQPIRLYDGKNLNVQNQLGKYETEVSVWLNDEKIQTKDNAFVPQVAGDYQVIYTVTDSVGRVNEYFNYTINVALDPDPVLVSGLPVYYGFAEGNTYQLHPVYVVDYTGNDFNPVKADVYVNGQKYNGNTYTPSVSKTEELNEQEVVQYITLEYRYGNKVINYKTEDGQETPLTYNIPVRNLYKKAQRMVAGRPLNYTAFMLNRFFKVDESLTEKYEGSFKVLLNGADTKGSVGFINPLNPENLQVDFKLLDNETGDLNVKAISLYFTLQSDCSKVLKITWLNDGEKTLMYIGDRVAQGNFKGSLTNAEEISFSVILKNGSKAVWDGIIESKIDNVLYYQDGSVFNGFEGKVLVNLEIEKYDQTKPAGVEITSINGQTFNSGVTGDTVVPEISLNGEYSYSYESGEIITIYSANAFDVLSNVDYGSLKVKVVYVNGEDEEPVKDVNGLLLSGVDASKEYQINAEKMGDYKVIYTVKDERNGSENEQTFTFNVMKRQKPVIKLKSKLPTSVKVGSKIKIPSYSVTFMSNNEENVHYVIYRAPDDRHQYLTASSFVATEVGEYAIRFFALDVYGNYTILEYTVNVVA